MRILVASGTVPPDASGPATHLTSLLPEVLRRGHALDILAFGHTITVAEAHATLLSPDRPLLWRQAAYAAAYARLARTADVVYVTSLGLPRYRTHRRVVLRVPGDRAWERAVNRGWVPPHESIDRFQAHRYGPIVEAQKRARRREVRAAVRVLVPSRYLQAMVTGWGASPAQVTVIPSSVESIGSPVTRDEARLRLGWTGEACRLVTAVRLTPWKGVDALLDMMPALPGATLTVMGDGPMRPALEARAAPLGRAVTFTGTLPPDEVRLRLAAADYFVLYSGYEGLSHSILEALACGTPVIASRQGGNPELVHDGVNGLLVAYPDRAALRAALLSAVQPGVRARLAARTRDGLDAYDAHRTARQVVDLLEAQATGSDPACAS